MTTTTNTAAVSKPTIKDCMDQAQTFASAWSLVGHGAFGTTLEQATAEKEALESMLRAALAAPAQAADPWREAVANACMVTEACLDNSDPVKTVNSLIDWHLKNERFHAAPMQAVPAPEVLAKFVAAQERLGHDFEKVLQDNIPALYAEGSTAAHAHPDDAAVDRFAMEMKSKLAAARAKGRSGWDTPECTQQHLSNLLREHVEKGDPRDVANFCAFLWVRGEAIAAVPAPGVPSDAPTNNLPTWEECQLRTSNSDFIAERVATGGYGADCDSKLATELHRFIYEYDDQDAYKSAWFRHRLEKVLQEAAAGVTAAPAQAGELKECAIGDSNFAAGMLLGWNLCVDDDAESFGRLRGERMQSAIQASRAARGAAQAAPVDADVQQDAERLDWLDRQIKDHAIFTGYKWQEAGYENDRGLVCAIQRGNKKASARAAIDTARAAQGDDKP